MSDKVNRLLSVSNGEEIIAIEQFKIEQLDEDGRAVYTDFRTQFETLRKKQAFLPPEQYTAEANFLLTSCTAQTDAIQRALKYHTLELAKDLKVLCEMNGIARWQRRHTTFADYIREQRRLRRPLPLRYAFWQRVGEILWGIVLVFFPLSILSLLLRRRGGTKSEPPKVTGGVNPPIGDNPAVAVNPPAPSVVSGEPASPPASRKVKAGTSLKNLEVVT